MATSKVQVTEGLGKNIATYSLTEDAVTKDIQRVALNDSSGVEIEEATNGLNSIGPGILAAGLVAQFDDTSPQTVTENYFGHLRMSANGILYVGGNIADHIADSGNPLKIGGKYNASAPTYSDGDRFDAQGDINGNIKSTEATKGAGEDLPTDTLKVEQRFGYGANISTNATTVVKNGSGYAYGFTVNNPSVLTVANLVITAYDNTAGSGTIIGIYTVTFAQATLIPFFVPIMSAFGTGFTLVTSGPTVTGNITPIYR